MLSGVWASQQRGMRVPLYNSIKEQGRFGARQVKGTNSGLQELGI